MLLAIPTELRSHIVTFLPRRDMAVFARTSQHFHAVVVKILYEHVELRSIEHVKAFFEVSSLLPAGSTVAVKHAKSKRAQWEMMKSLEIAFLRMTYRYEKPVLILPRSLRGPGATRLRLDQLRLAYYEQSTFLVQLLKCLDPLEVSILREHDVTWADNSFDRWASSIRWNDIVHFTLVGRSHGREIVLASTSTRLLKVTKITLVCRYWSEAYCVPLQRGAFADVPALLRLCPNAEALKMRVDRSWERDTLEDMVVDGFAGKPADFFSIEVMPEESDVWGNVVPEGEPRMPFEDASV